MVEHQRRPEKTGSRRFAGSYRSGVLRGVASKARRQWITRWPKRNDEDVRDSDGARRGEGEDEAERTTRGVEGLQVLQVSWHAGWELGAATNELRCSGRVEAQPRKRREEGGVQQDASCGGSPEELAGYRGVCKVVDETAREGQLGRAGQGRGGYFCVV